MRPLKIVVVGPSKCGKSSLVDLISLRDNLSLPIPSPTQSQLTSKSKYVETKGCRIVEVENFETHSPLQHNNIKIFSSIQFWDVGGTSIHHPDKHLPAIVQDADGIVFMYNPNSPAQCSEIQQWFDVVVTEVEDKNRDDHSFLVVMNNGLTDMNVSPVASIEQFPSCFDTMETIQYSHATESYEIRNRISDFVKKLSTM